MVTKKRRGCVICDVIRYAAFQSVMCLRRGGCHDDAVVELITTFLSMDGSGLKCSMLPHGVPVAVKFNFFVCISKLKRGRPFKYNAGIDG